MIRVCSKESIDKVLNYIGNDKLKCFYLYLDLKTYGIENGKYQLWELVEDKDINMVAYSYYDCLHLFSKCPSFNNDLLDLVYSIKPRIITGSKDVIKNLKRKLVDKGYNYEENFVITRNSIIERGDNFKIFEAKEEDLDGIVSLMLQDPVFSKVYTRDKLLSDLYDRMQSSSGRSFIIKNTNGHIVATNSIYVDTEDMAVIGGLVTDLQMRGKGLGRAITAHTWNLLQNEGKRGLAFLESKNDNTILLHKKMGFDFIQESARLIRV